MPLFADKKVLITGATGQVARQVAEDLARRNEVWCLGRFVDPNLERALTARGMRTWRWDMDGGEFDGLPADFTHVLHSAAYRGNGSDFEAVVAINSIATGRLMTHCRNAESFLFVSTGAIYARKAADHRHVETDPLGGLMPWLPTYPVGKIAAEGTVRAFGVTLDLPTTIARLNVAYGPHGHGGMPVALVRRMLAGEPIEIPREGQNWCNPIHTDDVAQQVPQLWDVATVPPRVVNWGGDEMVGVQDLVTYLSTITGVRVTFMPSDVTRETNAFDNARRKALIGDCQVAWREGMLRTLEAHFSFEDLSSARHGRTIGSPHQMQETLAKLKKPVGSSKKLPTECQDGNREVRSVHDQYDVIVVGGGPAGATASGLLSKWGRRVLLLEKEKFPRYHIGESLVPGIMPAIEELGATRIVEELGAMKKYGVSLIWGDDPEPWSIRFAEGSRYSYVYQVKRAEFDNLLLTHTRRLGTTVIEEVNVREVLFEGDRCTGVRYSPLHSHEVIDVHAPFVIDASGQNKIMARRFQTVGWHSDLKNLAAWTYFQGGSRYDGEDGGNILLENRPPGWLWLIPFSDRTCSVGFVAPIAEFDASGLKPAAMLYQSIDESREVQRLLAGAVEVSRVRTTKDWSYTCERMSGPGFVQIGDAAAFIDPLFSTGVMLAMKSALSAARGVNKILDEPSLEAQICQAYEDEHRAFLGAVISFVRFFYDPSRKVWEYFEEAHKMVDPARRAKPREDFVILISGLLAVDLRNAKYATEASVAKANVDMSV